MKGGSTRMIHRIPLLTLPSTATVVLSACDSNPCAGMSAITVPILLILWTYSFFYKQLYFWPPESQIFENRSNLASNCRTSNPKFLATFEPCFCLFSIHLSLKLAKKNLATSIPKILSNFEPHFGNFYSNSNLNSKMGLVIKKSVVRRKFLNLQENFAESKSFIVPRVMVNKVII